MLNRYESFCILLPARDPGSKTHHSPEATGWIPEQGLWDGRLLRAYFQCLHFGLCLSLGLVSPWPCSGSVSLQSWLPSEERSQGVSRWMLYILHIKCRDILACSQNGEHDFWLRCKLALPTSTWIQTRSYCSAWFCTLQDSKGPGGKMYNHLIRLYHNAYAQQSRVRFPCLEEHAVDWHFSGSVKNERKWCYSLHFCLLRIGRDIFAQ